MTTLTIYRELMLKELAERNLQDIMKHRSKVVGEILTYPRSHFQSDTMTKLWDIVRGGREAS